MKTLLGTVTSISGKQTATVSVERLWTHPIYKKSVKRTKKFACHVDKIKVEVGDQVVISQCPPKSKTKHFEVTEKVAKVEKAPAKPKVAKQTSQPKVEKAKPVAKKLGKAKSK